MYSGQYGYYINQSISIGQMISGQGVTICVSCGYTSYILCDSCHNYTITYTLCHRCVLTVNPHGQNCDRCSRPISNIISRLQNIISSPINSMNPSHLYNSGNHNQKSQFQYQVPNLVNKTRQIDYMQNPSSNFPTTQQNEKMKQNSMAPNLQSSIITIDELIFADRILEKPVNNSYRLKRERQRNCISDNQRYEFEGSEYDGTESQFTDFASPPAYSNLNRK